MRRRRSTLTAKRQPGTVPPNADTAIWRTWFFVRIAVGISTWRFPRRRYFSGLKFEGQSCFRPDNEQVSRSRVGLLLRPRTERPARQPAGTLQNPSVWSELRWRVLRYTIPTGRNTLMQLRVLALSAALIGVLSVSPSFAQRNLKAQQKSEEEAQKASGNFSRRFSPWRTATPRAMLTRKYSDSLVQGYVNSLGQSLVPADTPASTTFSFRVVEGHLPECVRAPGREDLPHERHAGACRERSAAGHGPGP